MDFINEWKAYGRKNVKVLTDEQIVRVCIDFDFDNKKIQSYLKTYETDDKYKGLEEYEWNTTQTKQQKVEDRRRKAAYAERLRLRKEQDVLRAEKRVEAEARKAKREEN